MILEDSPTLAFFRGLVEPMLLLGLLYLCIIADGHPFTGADLLLMIVAFFVSSYVYEQIETYRRRHRRSATFHVLDVFVGWITVVIILMGIGRATGIGGTYSLDAILPWFLITPFVLLLVRRFAYKFAANTKLFSAIRSAAIVGANNAGAELCTHLASHPASSIEMHGFFDDRELGRRKPGTEERHLGQLSDIASYVRHHHINLIFISLPMSTQPRLLSLLDDLKDTTASIYFVPDMRNFEFMQSRVGEIGGVPLLGICESPFIGINGILKRASDIVLALLILLALAPIMAAVAIGVKISSPGPIIFAQRRHGLDGKEITVYKFRSMAVCEDGATIVQAKRDDVRVTRLGKFLRLTSLDELPQLFNVLLGSMSIVGPRPHAVAHNELYRGLIKGYMLRHKVRPGITGWAQVNGCRGETESLEKMKARVEYDLEYLRNWSLILDMWIIVKTVIVVLKRDNAY